MALEPAGVRAILLDIEGTTTPVDFVFRTLFPFARERARAFLDARMTGPDVRADLALLRAEHAADLAAGQAAPPWSEEPGAVTAYVHWLMDRDRKSTGLKSLQGKIWEEGYRTGPLRGEVYDDVPRAFARWRSQGRRIAIFSSGSVLAQKLLFSHSRAGDLTPFIDAYFDTTTGPKREAASYALIARALGLAPAEVLFVSDVAPELDAAREAGMATALAARSGDAPASTHPVVRSFDEIGSGS
jgi:enolase-phosphatase E1